MAIAKICDTSQVSLESAVETSRRVELRGFLEEFADLLAWQELLFSRTSDS